MKKQMGLQSKIEKFVVVCFLLGMGQGCSKSNFVPSDLTSGAVTVGAQSPLGPPAVVHVTPGAGPGSVPLPVDPCSLSETRLTKILFMVDTSGSNYGIMKLSGTDPKKSFRAGAVQKFLDKYESHKNIQWSFMTFAGTTAKDYTGHGGVGTFVKDPSLMQKAVNSFLIAEDWGDTPYRAALRLATNAILTDPDVNTPANALYYVVMITDGYPTDITSESQIQSQIQSLTYSALGRVSLNTIFYGTQGTSESTGAIALLGQMALAGGGQFANVNSPESGINIDDVIHPHCTGGFSTGSASGTVASQQHPSLSTHL
jgi:hypothetical protein